MIEIVMVMSMFAGCLAHAGEFLPRTRYTRNGGMRFFRIGRLQTSWCVCKRSLR